MRKMKQLFQHVPELGSYGDCQRTVLACLFNCESPEDVPHSPEARAGDGAVFWAELDAWLERRGVRRMKMIFDGRHVQLRDVLETMGNLNPGVYYTLAGRSGGADCNHVVICLDDKVHWDTSLRESGVVGPCLEDGYYWLEWFVPSALCA